MDLGESWSLWGQKDRQPLARIQLKDAKFGKCPFVEGPLMFDVTVRHAVVEQVAHRVDENLLGPGPADRVPDLLLHETEVEAKLERMIWDSAKSFGKGFGVAVRATGADLRATAHRVLGCVRPFDFGVVTHDPSFVTGEHTVAGGEIHGDR